MNGVKLSSMEMSDMLDVIHYIFEEDLYASTAEEVDAKSKVRAHIYNSFYNKPYKYASSSSTSTNKFASGDDYMGDDLSGLQPFDPSRQATKPYIPPTEFNEKEYLPFGKTLDAPLG